MGDRAESWDRFCKESDASVERFNREVHAKCPFCGGSSTARWNYNGDYDPYFIIECCNCEARVKTYSFEECVKQWERRCCDEQMEKDRIELHERVTKAEEKVKESEKTIGELASCLESAFKKVCSGRIPCSECFAHQYCNVRDWRTALESVKRM